MKKIIILMIIAVFLAGCSSVEFTGENKGTFLLKIKKNSGKLVDFSCNVDLSIKNKEVFINGSCKGGYQDEKGNVFKCDVALDTEGQPITKVINISENCEIYSKISSD